MTIALTLAGGGICLSSIALLIPLFGSLALGLNINQLQIYLM